MDDHLQSLQSSALTATRHAATLPTDLPFYRAVDPRVSQQIDSISSRVLHLTHQLLQLSSSLNPNLPVRPQETLQDPDCLMFHFHSSVVDVMDHLFERTVSSPSSVETHTHTSFAFQKDSCLDQALGRNKAPTITINKDSAPNPRVSVLVLGGSCLTEYIRKRSSPMSSITPPISKNPSFHSHENLTTAIHPGTLASLTNTTQKSLWVIWMPMTNLSRKPSLFPMSLTHDVPS